MNPKFSPRNVLSEEEDGAFLNANLAEFRHAGTDQLAADTALTMTFGHGQMMQITATTVVATQHGANDAAILLGHKTHARIAAKKCGDGWARIGFIQTHAFGSPPQGDDRIVIFDAKNTEDYSVSIREIGNLLFHSTAWS